jgi:hypothetical protein
VHEKDQNVRSELQLEAEDPLIPELERNGITGLGHLPVIIFNQELYLFPEQVENVQGLEIDLLLKTRFGYDGFKQGRLSGYGIYRIHFFKGSDFEITSKFVNLHP